MHIAKKIYMLINDNNIMLSNDENLFDAKI